MKAWAVGRRIVVKLRVSLKLLLVENLEREVRTDEHVNVQINERERAVVEECGRVDVAVEVARFARRLPKKEDAVPAVSPEELRAVCAGLDYSEEWMDNLTCEGAFDDD